MSKVDTRREKWKQEEKEFYHKIESRKEKIRKLVNESLSNYENKGLLQMEYDIKQSKVNYTNGRYFMDTYNKNLYQIIYDSDRGYALLNVDEGILESDFNETIECLIAYTRIGEMKPLKQTIKAEFEITNEYDL